MSENPAKPMSPLAREGVLFLSLLLVGLILLPLSVYLVGGNIFGDYAGGGIGSFYGTLYRSLFGGNIPVLFLILTPYLLWQTARATLRIFRNMKPGKVT
jgi:hypothetical protein